MTAAFLTEDGMRKVCGRCRQTLPISDFHRNTTRSDGLQARCKQCQRETWKKPASRTTENHRAWRLSREFGISIEDYDELLRQQGGKCAICRRSETQAWRGTLRRLAVDHDHVTRKVRGLLCASCNTMLGKADDSVELLVAAIAYLGGDL